MCSTPIAELETALASQVLAETVSPHLCRPFPPPLGAWLTRGKAENLRATMRRCGVTPAGLLYSWLWRYPFRLKVATWGRKRMEERAKGWPDRLKRVYARDRNAMAQLFEAGGKLSDATRLACARYGAWRAEAAESPGLMRVSELKWAGLAVQALEAGPIAFCGDDGEGIVGAVDAAGDAWWLLSDNCRTEPKGAVSFRVSGWLELFEAGKDAQRVVTVAKQVFAARGSRISVKKKEGKA